MGRGWPAGAAHPSDAQGTFRSPPSKEGKTARHHLGGQDSGRRGKAEGSGGGGGTYCGADFPGGEKIRGASVRAEPERRPLELSPACRGVRHPRNESQHLPLQILSFPCLPCCLSRAPLSPLTRTPHSPIELLTRSLLREGLHLGVKPVHAQDPLTSHPDRFAASEPLSLCPLCPPSTRQTPLPLTAPMLSHHCSTAPLAPTACRLFLPDPLPTRDNPIHPDSPA
ncbi:uncharacterized protein LOC123586139 isoform X2 [Leopardus geoffroyi]|uniref:uncharacterized protein LOC123586139 isoform X2 n=1 Tax=Leopardus geoffroyi TaxID=46844 RepID=UPI001E2605D5|nr:uncharacterized protein LOC123586139 isoform X2 [Leopardus geoffroyi]